MEIAAVLSEEFTRPLVVTQAILDLFQEGGTVPFIARYRKEATQNMDETALHAFDERRQDLLELVKRKETVLKTVQEQGKLTPELEKKIEDCRNKLILEELYLPYRPKRKTRASVAKEKGLEPLALAILNGSASEAPLVLANTLFAQFKEVASVEEALTGASDILAEQVAEDTDIRAKVRNVLEEEGFFNSKVHPDYKDKKTKFDMYYDFRAPVLKISSHNLLAMRRGENEGVLVFGIEADEEKLKGLVQSSVVRFPDSPCGKQVAAAAADGYERLMRPSIVGGIRLTSKEKADEEAIRTFAENLRQLILFPPAGSRPLIAIDPGFRTGCKAAALDATGRFLTYEAIFPTEPRKDIDGASRVLKNFLSKYGAELIAIGNGTASRETESFVRDFLKKEKREDIRVVLVNESGASVYSASPVAVEEFPDQDVTVRGAISIGRRLQDPLAELVKIEPRSLGVGQYQHDVDQKRLKKKLEDVVESCVNLVGVDLNTASPHLLAYVAGISPRLAKAIVDYRNKKGGIHGRMELNEVPGIGPRVFEQCAGFLRVRGSHHPLDNSAVHPERYPLVEQMAARLKTDIVTLAGNDEMVTRLSPADYVDEAAGIGLPTVTDIIKELAKPGRDPRREFKTAEFKEGVHEIKDLAAGMILEGNVTNVADFGAFVDIGVHQDGLVHVSELANRYVQNPRDVVKVGDIVKVKVLDVDADRKRISLSMKALAAPAAASSTTSRLPQQNNAPKRDNRNPDTGKGEPQKSANKSSRFSLQDLMSKFHSS